MQKIKTFVLANCPHCQKDFYVKLEESPIEVGKLYTPAEMMIIKEEMKAKIKLLNIPKDKELEIINSIDSEESIFDREDADQLVEIIKRQHEKQVDK